MLEGDSKAIAQFIKKTAAREDIVIKSDGKQLYSYVYAADAVTAILHILSKGARGEAYNVAADDSDITLKDLTGILTEMAGTNVVYEEPDDAEKSGYSNATIALLDTEKIKKLGWSGNYSLKKGLSAVLEILWNQH